MNTSIVYTKEVWSDDDFYRLSLDGKLAYWFLLCSPDRGYLPVFKFNKRFVSAYTGLNESQVDVALDALVEKGFVEVYNSYIGIKKAHVARVGGPYGAINTDRELQRLPDDVRLHFFPDNTIEIALPSKEKKKTGPPKETIKQIIARQPLALRGALAEFVADRIERKRPPTTRAVKGWITTLDKLYPNDPLKQAKSVEQSIERGWMGFFEIKEDAKKESTFL